MNAIERTEDDQIADYTAEFERQWEAQKRGDTTWRERRDSQARYLADAASKAAQDAARRNAPPPSRWERLGRAIVGAVFVAGCLYLLGIMNSGWDAAAWPWEWTTGERVWGMIGFLVLMGLTDAVAGQGGGTPGAATQRER